MVEKNTTVTKELSDTKQKIDGIMKVYTGLDSGDLDSKIDKLSELLGKYKGTSDDSFNELQSVKSDYYKIVSDTNLSLMEAEKRASDSERRVGTMKKKLKTKETELQTKETELQTKETELDIAQGRYRSDLYDKQQFYNQLLKDSISDIVSSHVAELQVKSAELSKIKHENDAVLEELENDYHQKLADVQKNSLDRITELEEASEQIKKTLAEQTDLSEGDKLLLQRELTEIKLKLELSQREKKAIDQRQSEDILGITKMLREKNIPTDSHLGIIDAYVRTKEINKAKRNIYDCFSLKELGLHEEESDRLVKEMSKDSIKKELEHLKMYLATTQTRIDALEQKEKELGAPVEDDLGGGGKRKRTIRKNSVKNKRRQNNRRKKTLKR